MANLGNHPHRAKMLAASASVPLFRCELDSSQSTRHAVLYGFTRTEMDASFIWN